MFDADIYFALTSSIK